MRPPRTLRAGAARSFSLSVRSGTGKRGPAPPAGLKACATGKHDQRYAGLLTAVGHGSDRRWGTASAVPAGVESLPQPGSGREQDVKQPSRAHRLVTALLLLVGAAALGLGAATGVPDLSIAGAAYLLGAWLHAVSKDTRRWRALRIGLVAIALVLGIAVTGAVGYVWWHSAPPAPDAFYDPPAGAPSIPGALLRQEPFSRAVPAGAQAWRILYTTTRDELVPAFASAVVLAPADPPPGPRPVVAWMHGTTGVAPGCAPSVLPAPFPFDATIPALTLLLEQGWVFVGTDYTGLGTQGPHPYLIGQGEARSALDAVRAARQIDGITLSNHAVIWGHSQGGHAALWTGILAPHYAPDLAVMGVAALAPATDLPALVDGVQHTLAGRILTAYVAGAYSDIYDDVLFDDYVGPTAEARGMAGRCLSGHGGLLSVLVSAALGGTIFIRPPTTGPLGQRIAQNTPDEPIDAPLFIAQGTADAVVLPSVQERFVRRRCDAGQSLEYRTYDGRDHVGVVAPDSPLAEDLIQWTRERLAGAPAASGCQVVAR
jgi:hypothetical protein